MEKENLFLKKEEWGQGEWLEEPGHEAIEYFEYKGYKCVLSRNYFGAWCGYVSVPKTSKFTQKDVFESFFDVHGGITWAEDRLPWESSKSEERFWLGFDCFHYGDYSPRHEKILEQTRNMFGESIPKGYGEKKYRTMEYARNEINKMIDKIEAE